MAEQAGEEREEQNEDSKPSLFPLFPLSDSLSTGSRSPQWLCNSSFTVNISSAQPSAAALHYDPAAGEKSDSDDDEIRPTKPPPDYKLLDSSASDCEKEEMPKKKKKKKMKRDSLRGEDSGVPRKSGVEVWAGSETKNNKDYYFDTKGDRDNLAFGCLYRMDVARYRLHSPTSTSSFNLQVLYRWRRRISTMDLDGDADSLDRKSREVGRYFSAKYATLERHKDFRHLRVVALQKFSTIPGAFIPFSEAETSHEHDSCGPQVKAELEESWEEEVLRKTKEFNMMSRKFPHDGQLWLAFAEFQDKIAAKQPQKAARLQIMEKKISILEKAVELNPDNDELLLSLLKAYQGRDSTEVLNEKWEKILLQHSGNCKLWKEFLDVCQRDFSRFKVSNTRKIYTYAIQAISSACNKLCRQADQSARLQIADPILVQLELGLVDIFVNLCRFEWQTGYQELATALFQAEIEYSLFCPSLLLTEQSKHTLFEHFWSSSGARIGEDGALGWSNWLEKEEENRQSTSVMDFPQENEVGGWTGWTEPLSRKNVTNEEEEKLEEDDVGEDFEDEDTKQEEDVYSLMKKLGISIDFEAGTDVKDPSTWNNWSKKESSRDYEQWMPMRENSGVSSTDETPSGQCDEQLSRVILFEDVSEYLFSLRSEEARFFLVTQFVDFFGGKISRGLCTNTPSWTENCLSLETFPDSILEDLRRVHEVVTGTRSSSSHFTLESLLGSSDDARRQIDVTKFLRNALFLCLNAFPRNYILEEALIDVEELFSTQFKPFSSSVTPSRALAKSLLKNDRQDLLLCGVYARNEAANGNIDLARRVFDMALTSIEGLPVDLQANAPLLYFWYSEMELAACGSGGTLEASPVHAIHILSCLGNGVKYSSFKCQPSSLQLLKARQGFKEQIKKVCSAWARGDVKDQSVALICSASLFEDLTMGLGSGIAIFEEAFSAVLPGRRSESYYLESLFNHYIKTLQKNLRQSKLLKVWESILQGLQIYPYNPKLFAAFVEVGCLYTVPNKLRQIFDQYCRRKPSLIVWLFALSYELVRAGSQHRIKGLFERALDDYKLQKSVLLWRCYLAYEINSGNFSAARRIFFRAIHACPWSKKLWLDGFLKLHMILTAKELSDLQEVMRDKELHLRTDIYEILLQDEVSG